MRVNGKADAAKYVRDTVVALSHIASGAGLDTLTYLLDIATLEANHILTKTSERLTSREARL